MIDQRRIEMLQRQAAQYDAWEEQNLPGAHFDIGRSRTGSDYNQHYADYEADPGSLRQGPAKVVKVGPKGYIHGWIYVGPQAVDGQVFNSNHGHGRVTAHGDSHVEVAFDNGHTETYHAKFKDKNRARLYGPSSDTPKPPEPKPEPPEAETPKPGLTLQGMKIMDEDGKQIGLIRPRKGGKFRWMDKKTYEISDTLFDNKEDAFHSFKVCDVAVAQDKQLFAARAAQAASIDRLSHVKDRAKAQRVAARRKRIVDIYGDKLQIHDDPETTPIVRKHMNQFFVVPETHHDIIADAGHTIHVGKGSVGDQIPELADVHPSGYPEGTTWKDSAGGHRTNKWLVFGNTAKHGSHNMPAHESGHAIDFSFDQDRGPLSAQTEMTDWGVGFRTYFDGLVQHNLDHKTGIKPYFAPDIFNRRNEAERSRAAREMFAEAYSAFYGGGAKSTQDRARAIDETLKGFKSEDIHAGTILVDYFEQLDAEIKRRAEKKASGRI